MGRNTGRTPVPLTDEIRGEFREAFDRDRDAVYQHKSRMELWPRPGAPLTENARRWRNLPTVLNKALRQLQELLDCEDLDFVFDEEARDGLRLATDRVKKWQEIVRLAEAERRGARDGAPTVDAFLKQAVWDAVERGVSTSEAVNAAAALYPLGEHTAKRRSITAAIKARRKPRKKHR